MLQKTFSELKADVLKNLDMDEETFIQDSELVDRFNDALEEMEAVYMNQNQEYFITEGKLINQLTPVIQYGLVSGQRDYFLPQNMYGLKIREIVYRANDNEIFIIPQQRGINKFAYMEVIDSQNIGKDYYRYVLINPSASEGMKLRLNPTPLETGDFVKIFYIRQAERIPYDYTGNEVIDLPMFYGYFKAAVSYRLALKEGHPRLVELKEDWLRQKELMQNTTAEKTASDENEITADLSSYYDQSDIY